MSKRVFASSYWLAGFGCYLFLAGIAGYASNPEAAKTALITGSVFGFLHLVLGMCAHQGMRWSLPVALGTLSFVGAAFAWRSTVSWMAVAGGETEKLFAAALITSMLVGVVLVWPRVFLDWRRRG
ncbi:MAG: hypothetical protein EA425_05355 [Puniceicoccaceae bacterium]|nr:MAG: hypothetical protein EA425_05355 [Puniceicoccaceae bacterium]